MQPANRSSGENNHHLIEGVFKAFALPRVAGQSSKGYSFTPSFRLISTMLRRIYTDTPKMLPA